MVTLEKQIACVKREIGMRKRVYPRWVAQSKMTKEECDRQIETMSAVLATLEQLQAQQQPALGI